MDSLSEFDIIKRYFSFADSSHDFIEAHPLVGVGDDAAVIPKTKNPLVVATDTLIEGVHFPADFLAEHIASRAMGVNLSDFAAMGATPRWMTMALSLSHTKPDWLAAFSQRLAELCKQYNVVLIGGDTTKIASGLVVSLTLIGETKNDSGLCLRRNGAQIGDDVWVSGSLGKGAGALHLLMPDKDLKQWACSACSDNDSDRADLLSSFYAPVPRLVLGESLVGVASAAIDISDGLVADAYHIASQSQVKIMINGEALPIHNGLATNTNCEQVRQWVLNGGDEYELLFTAAANQSAVIQSLSATLALPCTKIGSVVDGTGVNVLGNEWRVNNKGYTHF